MVSDVFAGQYQSVFKGKGIEFDEVRQYIPGDDIRSIDWNVTARTGTPYIKKFVEERELTVIFLLDLSASSYFGTVNKLKRQIAAEVCSLLSLAAMRNNDKVGLILFTDRIEKFVPPRKGIRHILRIVREVLYFAPAGRGTDISGAIEYLNRIIRRKAVCFIISDFYDDNFEKILNITNRRHDITAITITDPKEMEFHNVGLVNLVDAETGEEFLVDTSSSFVRERFKNHSLELFARRRKRFRRLSVDNIDIRTDTSYAQELFKFFRMRERRLRR
jgi:uncharacterized protein (DUF58 family)